MFCLNDSKKNIDGSSFLIGDFIGVYSKLEMKFVKNVLVKLMKKSEEQGELSIFLFFSLFERVRKVDIKLHVPPFQSSFLIYAMSFFVNYVFRLS